jgi:hypothetical protein
MVIIVLIEESWFNISVLTNLLDWGWFLAPLETKQHDGNRKTTNVSTSN